MYVNETHKETGKENLTQQTKTITDIEDYDKYVKQYIQEIRKNHIPTQSTTDTEERRQLRSVSRTDSKSIDQEKDPDTGNGTREEEVRKYPGRYNNPRSREIRKRPFRDSLRRSSRLGFRRDNQSNSLMRIQRKINNRKVLKLIKNDPKQNGISQNFGYESPMPWLSEEMVSINGVDHVMLRGTEFLTSVSVLTTAVTNAPGTRPGDCIYTVPLNPVFFSGTRLLNFARLYQKYRYKTLIIEYVPLVPSIQNGSICQFFTYDPNENIFIEQNQDTRLREAMSHLGSSMTNIYSYARTHLVEDDQISSYFCHIDGDVRLEQQGMYYMLAASTFSPSPGSDQGTLTIGNLIMHYEIELLERGLDEDPSTTTITEWVAETELLTYFTNIGGTNVAPIKILSGPFLSLIGFTLNDYGLNHISIIIPQLTLYNQTAGHQILVNTEEDNELPLLSDGSVWYITLSPEDSDYMDIYTSIGDALTHDPGIRVVNTNAGTDEFTFRAVIYTYNYALN
jgi:uncharacterized short protein YbdD (DUF466 family)